MKKVGIVTSARELNYGALLQAYALQKVVSDMGYETSLLWWDNQKVSRRDVRLIKLWAIAWSFLCHPSIIKKSIGANSRTFEKDFTERSKVMFQEFEDECLNITFLNYRKMKSFASDNACKAIIAGSDQIWNSYALYIDPFYYLRFAPKTKRIAYAPSLGKNDIPDYNQGKMRKYIRDFKSLSVREQSGAKLINELTGLDVPVVLDPSFLMDNELWRKLERKIELPSKYLLFYFLDEPNTECLSILKSVAEERNLPVISIPYRFDSHTAINNLEYVDAGPREFLYLIDNADIILTDSFHGTAFSINYNKEFVVFDRQYGKNQTQVSRLLDLLRTFELSTRFVRRKDEMPDLTKTIDYDGVNRTLNELRKHSMEYLALSLSKN